MRKSNVLKMVLACCFCLLMSGNASAQNWKNILSGVVSAVSDKVSTSSASSIIGTWKYTGPDCKLDSDNLLAKAGAEIATSTVEKQLTSVLKKVGFTEGATFVFNSDSTYTSTVKGKTTKGTYSYDASSKELQLVSRLGIKFNATISQSALSSNKMSLLFKADKLMTLAQTVSGVIGKTTGNSIANTATSLLKNYDGLELGLALEKQ